MGQKPFDFHQINLRISFYPRLTILQNPLEMQFENKKLCSKELRRVMAVEIAATIVLSDLNEERDNVVQAVKHFMTEKPVILTQNVSLWL